MKASIIIKEVGPEETFRAMGIMENETMAEDWYDFDLHQLDEEQRSWSARYSQSSEVLSYIARNAKLESLPSVYGNANPSGRNQFFFVAYFRGVPIGALQLLVYGKDEDQLPEVYFLATHCGIRGCGVLLMEYAVNKSQQLGRKGKLKLTPYDRARSAYMGMGFIVNKDNKLELHPDENNDRWIWNENTQSYKFRSC
ncbi:GNAT family N-acetyltransferase [Xenorhabdus innexi]|nr:GNAT family N-acetyltransferase [Xenorhabdus innexi]